MSHGKKRFCVALQPDGSRRLKRSRHRTRDDLVGALVHYARPVGITYHYRRNADGTRTFVSGGCRECQRLSDKGVPGKYGSRRECVQCERIWLARLEGFTWGCPKDFRHSYTVSYRSHEATVTRRLEQAYRAGAEQEDDDRWFEFDRLTREARYDYW